MFPILASKSVLPWNVPMRARMFSGPCRDRMGEGRHGFPPMFSWVVEDRGILLYIGEGCLLTLGALVLIVLGNDVRRCALSGASKPDEAGVWTVGPGLLMSPGPTLRTCATRDDLSYGGTRCKSASVTGEWRAQSVRLRVWGPLAGWCSPSPCRGSSSMMRPWLSRKTWPSS